ncbi:unnamed protein product [Pedinophyceae sp. YPF-701]|nr:unnamed protein product [Pedinophyceae sp. YPF-701]
MLWCISRASARVSDGATASAGDRPGCSSNGGATNIARVGQCSAACGGGECGSPMAAEGTPVISAIEDHVVRPSGCSAASKPGDEEARVCKLRSLGVLDTPPEPQYDRITSLIRELLQVKTCVLWLLDDERAWAKSAAGETVLQMAREVSMCSWTLLGERPEVLVVPDCTKDLRFMRNPQVTGPQAQRFYAGAPLVTSDGYRLGTLCVADTAPHQDFSERHIALLANFAEFAVRELEKGFMRGPAAPISSNPAPLRAMDSAPGAAAEPPSESLVRRRTGSFRRVPSAVFGEFTSIVGEQRRKWRAVDSLNEAVLLVDAANGWRCLYGNSEFYALFGCAGIKPSDTLWDMIDVEGAVGAQGYRDVAARRGTFSLAATVRRWPGNDAIALPRLSCRCAPADQAADINALMLRTSTLRYRAAPAKAPDTLLYLVIMRKDDSGQGAMARLPHRGSVERTRQVIQLCPLEETHSTNLSGRDSIERAAIANSVTAVDAAANGATTVASLYSWESGLTSKQSAPVVNGERVQAPFVDVKLGRLTSQSASLRIFRGLWDGAVVSVRALRCAMAPTSTEEDLRTVLQSMLSVLVSHPGLVQTYKYAIRADGDEGGGERVATAPLAAGQACDVWIVQEYCGMGSLQDACDRREFLARGAGVGAALHICREVASALVHLHSRHIVHGDLSARNVMLMASPDRFEGCMAKVAGYGLATALRTEDGQPLGTTTHMPPEVLRGAEATTKADVFSFGVLMWQMATCERPHGGAHPAKVAARVLSGAAQLEFPDTLPFAYSALARRCLAADPEERPTSSDVLMEVLDLQAASL